MSRLILTVAFILCFSYPAWTHGELNYAKPELKNVDMTPHYQQQDHEYTKIKPIIDAKQRYREILEKLKDKHYKSLEINDAFSKLYLDSYIESLDPQKSYFLKSDIAEFNKWNAKLDDLLLDGEISPGYEMYNRFLRRAEDQLLKNIALLKNLMPWR